MKSLKLFSVVIVAALLFANMACACAPSDMNSEPMAHHHTTTQDETENAPCPHQDCDGCEGVLDRCSIEDPSVTLADRDLRTRLPKKIELGSPDLDLAFIDTGQAWGSLPAAARLRLPPARASWVAGTPIIRKDQLTE